jgi:hypothetical protein
MKLGILLSLTIATANPLLAADVREIELRRLFEPTAAERQAEREGRIFIYEAMRERDVERAMDEEFGRVENMMFIRLQKTDEHGEVQKDPETGEVQYHDDGC